jgi:SPP1 gp7 family putative phage head morphogenesis protein
MSPKVKAPVAEQKIATVKRQIPEQSIATAKRDYKRYQAYIKACKNPDQILNKTKEGKEKGIELFQEMKRDCHIGGCLDRLTLAVTRLPFAVTPGGETPQDIEAADFIQGQIKKHYYNLVAAIGDAVPMGYSVAEFWCTVGDMAEIAALKKRRQDRFTFDEDGLVLLKTESSPNGEAIAQEGFIVATYQEEDDNKFGAGVLSDCFWPWWFKKYAHLYWANYLERFNQPIVIGTFPAGTTTEKQDEFLEALESIQSDFALTIPEGWKAEFAKAMDSGAAASFENFISFLERSISRRILASAINEGEQKFGSKGSNETLKDIGDERIEAVAEFVAKWVNETLVARLSAWNFDLDTPPTFAILYANKKMTKEQADVLYPLIAAGVAVPAADIYEANGWKMPADDDLVLYKGKLIFYRDVAKENTMIAASTASGPPTSFAEEAPRRAPTETPGTQGVDGELVADGKMIDEVFSGSAEDLRGAYDEQQLVDLVAKAGDFTAASKALKKYKPKKLEEAWRDVIELGRWLGEYAVQRQAGEIKSTGSAFAEPEFKVTKAFETSFRKLKPKEAIAWLKSKIPVKKDVYDQLTGAAKNAAFYVAGLEDVELINAVREKMIQALEEGIPYEEFARDLKMSSGADPFFSNMKTAFYTNIHQAQAAQDYEALVRVRDLVPYLRFSAVIDSHTRAEHARWHGFVAPADDPIWDYLYSLLMDFNCRCRITGCTESDYNALAEQSRLIRGTGSFPTYTVNPTQSNVGKLKDLLKAKTEYADYLDGKLGSWEKTMAKTGPK